MEDPPYESQVPSQCLLARGATLGSCTVPLSNRAAGLETAVQTVVTDAGASWVETVPWFCADNECPTVVGNTIAWFDAGHIASASAAALEVPVTAVLKSDLG